MTPSEIAAERYVSLTTYRSDGSAKSLPVWIAGLGDDSVGFTTELSSFKVKRIQNDARVSIRPCNMKGQIDEDVAALTGSARVVSGTDAEVVRDAIAAKYGLQYRVAELLAWFRERFGRDSLERCGVIIEIGR